MVDYVSADEEENLWPQVTAFTASREALAYLLRGLQDIREEVPDEDGEREIVELWRDGGDNPNWPEWSAHLDQLLARLARLEEALS